MVRKTSKVILLFIFVIYPLNNLFSQDYSINGYKDFIGNEKFNEKKFDQLYIGNFLSSIFALKNGDYVNSLKYSRLSLDSKFESLELLENAFNSNIYLGKVENALKIVANIELLSNDIDQTFLYPTISEQLKRNDLPSALDVSNNLGIEKHDIFITKMINIWNYVVLGDKEKALMHLDSFSNENELNPEIIYYLKVQGLVISSYFNDSEEINHRYNILKKDIRKIPSRHFIDIFKVVYEKVDKQEAKEILITNLPKNLDLNLSIQTLKDNERPEIQYFLAKIFYEAGYIVARSQGLLNSIPFFWYALHIDKNNDQSKLILASFFSNVDQIDISLEILNEKTIKSPSWIIIEFEKSYLYEQKGNINLAISLIENFVENENFASKALMRISNIHRRNGDYENSLKIINSIDDSIINTPEIHYYRSLNLVLLKRWAEAINSFKVLLEVYPENPEVSNFVGYTLVDRNIRLEEGINLIKYAVSKEPKNGFYLDSLGWAFFKLEQYSKAIVYLERAIEFEPQEMEITDHLGDAYFKVGRLKEAKLVWKRALTLNGSSEIQENIERKLINNF
ncbi:MAG: hypothetical protein CMN37_04980 [SAR116 cluster bacterium]|nr:hypothetical protein [SAR116 cluster bacterium]